MTILMSNIRQVAIWGLMSLTMTACASEAPVATKFEVQNWAKTTLDEFYAIYPENFRTMADNAVLTTDYDFVKNMKLDLEKYPKTDVDLDEADLEFIRNVGVISYLAEHCELDWLDQNFLPMMQWQREFVPASQRNGYQIAILGRMHGFAQGRTDSWSDGNQIDCKSVSDILDKNLFADHF